MVRRAWLLALFGLVVVGCSTDGPDGAPTSIGSSRVESAASDVSGGERSLPNSTSASTAPPTTSSPTTSSPTTSTSTTTSTTTTTEAVPTTTPYRTPLADPAPASWGPTHSGYPATDIFIACGAEIVSPVNGVISDVRRVDSWDPAVDNPATRGGRSVAVVGDDGVRYYVAHLDEVDPALVAGERAVIGQRLGTVGRSGRSSACHVHFSISPPCPGPEWSVRRGVVSPAPYLDAWRSGEQSSPAAEMARWAAGHPTACADAMADPFAPDA